MSGSEQSIGRWTEQVCQTLLGCHSCHFHCNGQCDVHMQRFIFKGEQLQQEEKQQNLKQVLPSFAWLLLLPQSSL